MYLKLIFIRTGIKLKILHRRYIGRGVIRLGGIGVWRIEMIPTLRSVIVFQRFVHSE